MPFPGSSISHGPEHGTFVAINQDILKIAHSHTAEITAIGFSSHEFMGNGVCTPKLNLGWRLRFVKSTLGGPTDILFELDGFTIPSPLTVKLSQGTKPGSTMAPAQTFPSVRVTEDIMETSGIIYVSRLFCHVATSELHIQSYPYFTLTVTWSDEIKKAGLPKSQDAQAIYMDYMFESMTENPVYIDTKFWVFSKRADTMVLKPKAVFANSKALMKRSEYFDSRD